MTVSIPVASKKCFCSCHNALIHAPADFEQNSLDKLVGILLPPLHNDIWHLSICRNFVWCAKRKSMLMNANLAIWDLNAEFRLKVVHMLNKRWVIVANMGVFDTDVWHPPERVVIIYIMSVFLRDDLHQYCAWAYNRPEHSQPSLDLRQKTPSLRIIFWWMPPSTELGPRLQRY